jgi:hypothetical protein
MRRREGFAGGLSDGGGSRMLGFGSERRFSDLECEESGRVGMETPPSNRFY